MGTLNTSFLRDALKSVYGEDTTHLLGILDGRPHEGAAKNAAQRFNPLRLETLLEQSALLLDRCGKNRDSFYDLQIKAVEFAIERKRLDLAFERQTAEIELNRQLDEKDATSQSAAQSSLADALSTAKQLFTQQVASRDPASGAATWVGKAGELAFANATQNHEEAKSLAFDLEVLRLQSDILGIRGNIEQIDGSRTVAQERADFGKFRAPIVNQVAESRQKRSQIDRDSSDQLAALAAVSGHPLNYEQRSKYIEREFEQDFADLYERLLSAADGLRLIYGYVAPLPAPADKKLYLTDLAIWLRRIIADLLALELLQDQYSLIVSARNNLSSERGDWETQLRSGRLSVRVPATVVPQQELVRIRGLRLLAQSQSATGFWSATCTAPPLVGLKPAQTCLIGRIPNLNPALPEDIRYGKSLHNLSPIGTWDIDLMPLSPTGNKPGELTDLYLDLLVTSIPSSRKGDLPWTIKPVG